MHLGGRDCVIAAQMVENLRAEWIVGGCLLRAERAARAGIPTKQDSDMLLSPRVSARLMRTQHDFSQAVCQRFASDHTTRLSPKRARIDLRRLLRGTTRTSKRAPLRPGQLRHIVRDLGPDFYLE